MMTNAILTGPGRVLESVQPKFMVSLLQDDDATGEMPQQQFRQRLTQEILVQTQQQWVAPSVYSKQLAMSLQLMEKLVAIHDPGHLALTLINQRLQHLLNTESPGALHYPMLILLHEKFVARCAWKEKALMQRGLTVLAGNHCEQIFTRWRAGVYDAWSLSGRCFIALEELRWGAFGDACRLAGPDVATLLIDNLRSMATEYLALSIHAAPATRHFYHHWITPMNGKGEYSELLSWMGDWCDVDKHPVCWSVSQRWQNVASGMPRLCSAGRLAAAMIEEMF